MHDSLYLTRDLFDNVFIDMILFIYVFFLFLLKKKIRIGR